MVPSGSEMSLVFADRVLPSAGVPVMEREPVAPSSTLATAAVGVEEKVDVPPEESVEVALRRRNLPTRD